jgi:hypothetical protein
MSDTWTESLFAYRYPFDLRRFEDAEQYRGWFNFTSRTGDRTSTMEFEDRFRSYAAQELEPWLEVVYWKLFSQPPTRGEKTTSQVASHLQRENISPQALWHSCTRYVKNPTRQNFEAFRKLLGFRSPVIAVAFTFPAFMSPDQYPMIDTRIAKWVGHSMISQNSADPAGPQLVRPPYLDTNRTVLTMSDFEFAEKWIQWCRHAAKKLSSYTSLEWRARDVEMAVFHAWGGPHDRHPKIRLPPLKSAGKRG